ncbi:MAG: two-component hybrid sensor and regulator, partial [Phycisphaerales bacterium]|nr:two-component hybrid sensor and regulator [Phycisphaerales bacterium]
MAEEALGPAGMADLTATLAAQPAWSDLPVLLLLTDGERPPPRGAGALVTALRAAGNVAVLVRPVPSVALVTAVQAALRARARQYEVRDLLDREHAALQEAEQSAREAERANRLKDEFLATVSHELRTPLSAILLWSRLASTGRVPAADLPDALRSIETSARSQSQLIDDLLDASQMVAGK